MKNHRVWIEILLLASVVACAIALLIASLGAAAGATAAEAAVRHASSPVEHTYEGMVTCSRCGARHSEVLGQTAAECTRACVRGGANFALVKPEMTYLLDGDLGVLGKFAGQRARVVGELDGKTIKISSVSAAI